MAIGDLLDDAWQIELRDTLFVTACEPDESPSLIITTWLDGFGVPETRNDDVERPMEHGLFASPQFLGGRSMTVGVIVRADTFPEFRDGCRSLGLAWAPVSIEDDDLVVPMAFTMEDANVRYVVYGKPMRAVFGYANHALFSGPSGSVSDAALCEFLATDPRVYALDESAIEVLTAHTEGGLAFPHAFPHAFGTVIAGDVDCVNEGNIETYPTLTVTAGADGATGILINNHTTGKQWITAQTLTAGQTLTIDMAARTAMRNPGDSDVTNLTVRPPSDWFPLIPGTNVVSLDAAGAGTTLTIAWHHAYLI